MMNHTNNKIKKPLKGAQSLENSGFIKAFILFLIIVGILIYFKINPITFWNNVLRPIIEWGFDLITKVFELLFKLAVWAIDQAKDLTSNT